jgi:hypothetical protein
MPALPKEAFFTAPPDWGCEVLSPSTSRIDRTRKLPIYARAGVSHLWLVDPSAETLESFALEGGRWVLLATHGGDEVVRVKPFDALEVKLRFGEDPPAAWPPVTELKRRPERTGEHGCRIGVAWPWPRAHHELPVEDLADDMLGERENVLVGGWPSRGQSHGGRLARPLASWTEGLRRHVRHLRSEASEAGVQYFRCHSVTVPANQHFSDPTTIATLPSSNEPCALHCSP